MIIPKSKIINLLHDSFTLALITYIFIYLSTMRNDMPDIIDLDYNMLKQGQK